MDFKLSQEWIDKIAQTYRKLEAESGEDFCSRKEIEDYRQRFMERFGPDVLSRLDGDELLDLMRGAGKDALWYWLEFKNDDEFKTGIFGGIGGGSSLKYGFFKKKETGQWMTGSPQKQREISTQEALALARQQRDQMIRGAEIISRLPENANFDDYKRLQEDLARECPDVANFGWVHKYFSILFPEKIDDFHNVDYQKFYLMKMLINPPKEEGRYLPAYYYSAISRQTGIQMNQMTAVIKNIFGSVHKYWRIGTRPGGGDSIWQDMKDGGFVALGDYNMGDLSEIKRDMKGKIELREMLRKANPDWSSQKLGNSVHRVFKYATYINENDLIMAGDGQKILGIGRITGNYEFVTGSSFPHRYPVEWLNFDEWKMPESEGQMSSAIWEIIKPENIIETEKRIQKSEPIPDKTNLVGSKESDKLPIILHPIPAQIKEILDRKKQVILYGPPGTGKTYWAMRAVRELASIHNYGRNFDNLTDDEKKAVDILDKTSGFVRLCCFHPEYGYEGFIEGYRPREVNGNVVFEMKGGIFKNLCQCAMENPDKKYFLIIDEINRGDIPRIFGELIFLLEPDKRGISTILPLSGEPFTVPGNVFIIGTMNTADRSIALLDTALRRRFGFLEMMPDLECVSDLVLEGIPIRKWLKELNRRICEKMGQDGRNLQIGHSYFIPGGRPIGDFSQFAGIVRDEIIPLLEEYCYENFQMLEEILGSSLVDGKNYRIRYETFKSRDHQAIANALLSAFPDLTQDIKVIEEEAKEIIPEDETEPDLEEEFTNA